MIKDHLGNTWIVNGGDPASKLINRLHRKHYEYIVLPVKALATGIVPDEVPVIDEIVARVRLLDCLAEVS